MPIIRILADKNWLTTAQISPETSGLESLKSALSKSFIDETTGEDFQFSLVRVHRERVDPFIDVVADLSDMRAYITVDSLKIKRLALAFARDLSNHQNYWGNQKTGGARIYTGSFACFKAATMWQGESNPRSDKTPSGEFQDQT